MAGRLARQARIQDGTALLPVGAEARLLVGLQGAGMIEVQVSTISRRGAPVQAASMAQLSRYQPSPRPKYPGINPK